MTSIESAALYRLIDVAKGNSGQSQRVANFLLSWWNADDFGGFDPRNLWALDAHLADDIVTVFGMIARVCEYPPTIDPALEADFMILVRKYRPDLTR
ncbi:hypothetical protein HLB25_10235 [Dickeya dadantii]|nr:hypothetical protein [Dickeya dadantii]NPE67112.1 hypothetical protein [Dickeya dadantii]